MLVNCPLLNPFSWVSIFDKISCEDHDDQEKLPFLASYLSPLALSKPDSLISLYVLCCGFGSQVCMNVCICMSHWTCFIYGEHVETKTLQTQNDSMILSPTALQGICGRKGWIHPKPSFFTNQKIADFLELMKSELCFKKTTISGSYFICYWDAKLESQIIHPYQANKNRLGLHLSPTPTHPKLKITPSTETTFPSPPS